MQGVGQARISLSRRNRIDIEFCGGRSLEEDGGREFWERNNWNLGASLGGARYNSAMERPSNL